MTAALSSVQLLPAPVLAGPSSTRRRGAVQTLPLQASVGASLSAPRWLFIAGGAAVGALLLGFPGGVLGALGGYFLTR